jgi:two-component system chemotaxis response regulator CheB
MIKVFIIDDSILVRTKIINILQDKEEINVIGDAGNPIDALNIFKKVGLPDLFILDIEMPKMNGVEFLEKINTQRPTPVIIISSFVDEIVKNKLCNINSTIKILPKTKMQNMNNFSKDLINKIHFLTNSNIKKPSNLPSSKIISIGSSTGGVQILEEIVSKINYGHKGIVIVQHMPESFTASFASRLNSLTRSEVVEAREGDIIKDSKIIIAKGGIHLEVYHAKDGFRVRFKDYKKVNSHKPSVNVLFKSVAENVGKRAMGIVLTGMGDDGAIGLKMMREAGALTYAQDEKSSIVYGMPKVALEIGGVMESLNINQIVEKINNFK